MNARIAHAHLPIALLVATIVAIPVATVVAAENAPDTPSDLTAPLNASAVGAVLVAGQHDETGEIQFPYSEVEVVRERYENGDVKIERETTLDADGNYVNHGTWKMWNTAGTLVAEGQYDMGKRSGQWTRLYDRNQAKALAQRPFNSFNGPFVGQATFVNGQLEAEWMIVDAKQTKCALISFKDGKRHGPEIFWLPNGDTFHQAHFENGLQVGKVVRRNAQGEMKTVAEYLNGKQIVTKVEKFPRRRETKSEATFLGPKMVLDESDDFWNASRFASFQPEGEELRHGPWRSYYPSGKVQVEGFYQFDKEMGNFTWWHVNGQKAVEGAYRDGVEIGVWTRWHENGQKASIGNFVDGVQTGLWRQWDQSGRLLQKLVHDGNAPAELPTVSDAAPPKRLEAKHELPPLPWTVR